MNFVTSFSISSNGFVPISFTKKPEAPSIENYPVAIISRLLAEPEISTEEYNSLYENIITYFNGMTAEDKERSTITMTNIFNQTFMNDRLKLIAIEDEFKELMINCKFDKSKKVPSTNHISSQSETVVGRSEVEKFLELFNNLYAECVGDTNVEDYSNAALSKAILKLSEDHNAMGNGGRMKKLIELISSGIPPYCKTSTKYAQIELETYACSIFKFNIDSNSIGKGKVQNFMKNKVVRGSVTNDRIKIITERDLNNPEINRYLDSSAHQLEAMQEPVISKSYPESVGRNLAKRFFGIVRKSGLRETLIQSSVSLLTATMPAEKTKPRKTQEMGLSSNINIQTNVENSEIFVNFNGNLLEENISGSYSISEDSIKYISLNAFYNSTEQNSQQQKRIVQSIGISDPTIENIWAAFITFLFTYISIMVHCMLNSDNILNISVVPETEDNLLFLLDRQYLEEINIELKNSAMNINSEELKTVLIFAAAKGWSKLIYG